jgi:membrane-associated phospholipid phosphatase
VGLGLSAACIWIFFAIAEDIPEAGAMVRFDATVSNWLQAHGTEWGESVFVGISYFGAQLLIAVLVGVAIAFTVRRDWRRLALLSLTCLGGALLNAALKAVFHRSRPDFASEFRATSWSFPSGHAMNALLGYGLLAYWLAKREPWAKPWILTGAVIVIVGIGYARIYLGVHYLSDVVAGYSAGATWLVVCITGYEFADRRKPEIGGRSYP